MYIYIINNFIETLKIKILFHSKLIKSHAIFLLEQGIIIHCLMCDVLIPGNKTDIAFLKMQDLCILAPN